MTEDKKIEEVIEKYKAVFDNTECDIARSSKGVRFFYRYDEEYGIYDTFIRFKTAEELKYIIKCEILDDINLAIKVGADDISYKYDYKYIEETGLMDINKNVVELNCYLKEMLDKMSLISGTIKALQSLIESE